MPELASEKIKYCKRTLAQLRHAAALSPLNGEYRFAVAEAVSKIIEDDGLVKLGGLFSPPLNAEAARNNYLSALSLEPINARYHLGLGLLYARMGKYRMAEEEFIKAGELGSKDALLHYDLANYYLSFFGESKLLLVYDEYRKALISAAPEFQKEIVEDIYTKFGYSRIQAGDILPDAAGVRYCLAELLWSEGRYDESMREFEEALVLSKPGEEIIKANSLAWIGLIYKIKNNLKESIYYLEAAVEIDPDNGWSLYNLGDAYYKAGELDKVSGVFEEALKHNPDEYTEKEIRKILQQLAPNY